jgi:phosphonate transport system permease protein
MQKQRSPAVSAFLSTIPGLGQLYNGKATRGLVCFLSIAILAPLILWKGDNRLLAALVVFWLWNVWDAYQLARKRPSALLVPILALGLVIYTIGWGVTEIRLDRLFKDVRDIRPLVTSLLKPAVLEKDIETLVGRVGVQIPCSDNPPAKEPPPDEGPYLILISNSTCGEPFQGGEYITFVTDDNGNIPRMYIVATEPMPEARGKGPRPYLIEARVAREVGSPHLSETFFLVLEKMTETVFLALMATTLAIFVSIPLSFVAARNIMGGNPAGVSLYYLVRTVLNILRSIEPLIMAIIFVVWVGLGPFAGVLALAVHSIAALGKLYSEAVESIDPGPIEAVTATGANLLQKIVYAVIPQIIPPYLAFTIYRWDINVRMSTIIGFVGGGGIGFLLQQWIRLLRYEEAGAAVWAIAIVVAIMDYVSAKVRESVI